MEQKRVLERVSKLDQSVGLGRALWCGRSCCMTGAQLTDYETLPASSEAMIHIASIDNLAKRITDETTPTWRGTY